MSKNMQRIIDSQNAFNRKYGVNFDIEEFHDSIEGLFEIGGFVDANQMYRIKFTEIYKKAHSNFIDRKIENTLDFGVMINDFDENIVTPFYARSKVSGKPAPTAYGGWTTATYLDAVKRHLDTVPDNKHEYAIQRYNTRELRIRDMRAFTKELIRNNDATPEKLATIYCYYSALKKANEDRSYLRAIFVDPSRHLAEKRWMNKIKSYLELKTGGALSLENNENFRNVHEISNNDDISRNKEIVNNALLNVLPKEQPTELDTNMKEHVAIDASLVNDNSMQKTQKVSEKESSSKQNEIEIKAK